MNISNLLAGSSTSTLASSARVKSSTGASNSSGAAATSSSQGDSVGVSKMGDLMRQLGQLQESDPEAFQTVTANIAKQLEGLAESQSDEGSERISELAESFTQASKSGSMESLKPKGPPPGGPPPGGMGGMSGKPPRGAGAYQQQQRTEQETNSISDVEQIIANALSSTQ